MLPQKERKPSALNAYRSAASMTFFNPDISKIALLNYARLSYEIGKSVRKSTTAHHQISRETYPKTSEEQELTALLLSSYTNSGDYDGVLTILSSQNNYKDDRLLAKSYLPKSHSTLQCG